MTLLALGAALVLAATPAVAQDAADDDAAFWAPWQARPEAPAPQVRVTPVPQARITPVSAKIVADVAPQPEPVIRRILHIDRFWVVGSFR
jgi:hypothetical protein